MKCDTCHGRGCSEYFDMMACASCTRGPHDMPCPAHLCRICGGSGKVCPHCRGMRFVRSNVFKFTNAAHENVREITRCPVCCEGNNVNVVREREAILRYETRYRTWQAEAEARGEEFIEPSHARQLAEDAEQWRRWQESASQEGIRQRTRQKRHIARSREVEAKLDDRPPAPIPTEHDWNVLHGIVSQYRKPQRKAGSDR